MKMKMKFISENEEKIFTGTDDETKIIAYEYRYKNYIIRCQRDIDSDKKYGWTIRHKYYWFLSAPLTDGYATEEEIDKKLDDFIKHLDELVNLITKEQK